MKVQPIRLLSSNFYLKTTHKNIINEEPISTEPSTTVSFGMTAGRVAKNTVGVVGAGVLASMYPIAGGITSKVNNNAINIGDGKSGTRNKLYVESEEGSDRVYPPNYDPEEDDDDDDYTPPLDPVQYALDIWANSPWP